MTDRIQGSGGSNEDYQLMFLGDVSGGQALEDGQTLVWNEEQERFIPGSPGADLGYKTWCGYFSQAGTEAPAASVLENGLIGEIVWSYFDVGRYVGTLSGGFPMGRVFFPLVSQVDTNSCIIGLAWLSDDTVFVFTYTPGLEFSDNVLDNSQAIEIRVYDDPGA